MTKEALQKRKNWQESCGIKATNAEKNLYNVFHSIFKGTNFILHEKPKHLKNLYNKVQLSEDTLKQIFNPDISNKEWGISPDFAIENTENHKILFGEIKRQDGWIEGKKPSAGRGNAHERLCKLFTPGLIKHYRKIGRIETDEILPFWVVFEGDITRDPKRVREIALWFDNYCDNFFMWRDTMTNQDLINHFNQKLKKYLL